MLGQPVSMLIPLVVGVKLTGRLREGATATDFVLTVTEMLRKHGVVGKFVEYFGPGLRDLSLADRATIANMSPEYGATCGIFPIDKETLRYLRLTGRTEEQIALVEAYSCEQGMFHDEKTAEAEYSDCCRSISLPWSRVWPGRSGRRIAWCCRRPEIHFRKRCLLWSSPKLSQPQRRPRSSTRQRPRSTGSRRAEVPRLLVRKIERA